MLYKPLIIICYIISLFFSCATLTAFSTENEDGYLVPEDFTENFAKSAIQTWKGDKEEENEE
jgi:hypothetical protein